MSFLTSFCTKNTTTLSISQANAKAEANTKTKHTILKQLHIYGIFSAQIIASSIIIAFTLWLFIRLPEPEIHVTHFSVDALDKSNTSNRTLLHYTFKIHNPDIYKSLSYDVLVARISYSDYVSYVGAIVNFDVNGKGIHQRPRETTVLGNHSLNYGIDGMGHNAWYPEDLIGLKVNKTFIALQFVVDTKVLVFNRVIGTRQIMKFNRVYFDDDGQAFIDPLGGIRLKSDD